MTTYEDADFKVTTAGDFVDIDAPSEVSDHFKENLSSNGEGMTDLKSAGEILIRVELELAYSSEKFLNLDILLMHVAAKEGDFESLSADNYNVSDEAVEKGLEFDLLSGILDSEIRDLEKFTASLQQEIVDAHQMISSFEHLEEDFIQLEEKLHDSEKSLKQSQDQVADIKMQSARFQRSLSTFGGQENSPDRKDAEFSDNDQFSYTNTKLKMQTTEQRRHILRMLEKSLARELDLEKKLSESRHVEEDLKLKLHSAQEELFFTDDTTEAVFGRLLEAESSSVILMGISKELMGQLHSVQFTLRGSIRREEEMKVQLQNLMDQTKKLEQSNSELDDLLLMQVSNLKDTLKEVEDKYILTSSENFSLQEKVHSLEEKLKDAEFELQKANASPKESPEHHHISELSEMKNALRDSESKTSPEQTNEMNVEKMSLLEKQLRESDIQLQYAKASAEASQEQQSMLYSSIADMENLIEDLKSKVLKAENRVKSAETRSALLSDTNLELNDALNFLNGKTNSLETSLHQADNAKIETTKELGIRVKVIADLVPKLAIERERLQKQISSLTKENKILIEKFWKSEKQDSAKATSRIPSGEVLTKSAARYKANKLSEDSPLFETKQDVAVRDIEAGQLNIKFLLGGAFVLIVSVVAVYLFQEDRCPL